MLRRACRCNALESRENTNASWHQTVLASLIALPRSSFLYFCPGATSEEIVAPLPTKYRRRPQRAVIVPQDGPLFDHVAHSIAFLLPITPSHCHRAPPLRQQSPEHMPCWIYFPWIVFTKVVNVAWSVHIGRRLSSTPQGLSELSKR